MVDNLTAVIAIGVALVSLELAWSANRPKPASWRGNAGLFAEVFVTVVAATSLTRHAAIPALHWLSVRMP